MNHRTYDAQRYSPLDRINKANVKGLKLAYAVARRRPSAQIYSIATPTATSAAGDSASVFGGSK
jgi:hypothetical protein